MAGQLFVALYTDADVTHHESANGEERRSLICLFVFHQAFRGEV